MKDDKNFIRYCPKTHAAIFGRKYHLPNYRQGDYYNQDTLNEVLLNQFLTYGSGRYGFADEVHNTTYTTYCELLRTGKHTYYLERELAGAFMRTKLPLDMDSSSIEWKFPVFTVVIPKGLLTIDYEGKPKDITTLTIGHIEEMHEYFMPSDLAKELDYWVNDCGENKSKLALPFKQTGGSYSFHGFAYTGNLSIDADSTRYITYASIKPWGVKLKEITAMARDLNSTAKSDDADKVLQDQMEHLVLNVLLFMSALPIEYDAKPKVLRGQQKEGKRLIPELVEAKFVGDSQIRARFVTGNGSKPIPGAPTGKVIPAHAVAGHWKRQAYGPKRAERKFIFIHPYLTGMVEDEEQPMKRKRL